MTRWTVLAALLAVGCIETPLPPRPDVGRLDAGTTADDASGHGPDCGIILPCATFACIGGVVDVLAPMNCTACTYVPLTPSPCTGACRSGLRSGVATDLCEGTLVNAGDPCSTDGDCAPSAPIDEAWGDGPMAPHLRCDLPTRRCVRVPDETCDGADDDLDGTVDEGCLCAPVIHETVQHAIVSQAAFAGDRIATLSSDTSFAYALAIETTNGRITSTQTLMRPAMRTYTGLARVSDAFATIEITDTSDDLVRVHDDGTITRDSVGLGAAFGALIVPWGADIAVVVPESTTEWSLTRWTGSPLTYGPTTRLPLTAGAPAFAALDSGDLLVVDSSVSLLVSTIDAAGATHTVAMPDRFVGMSASLVAHGDRFVVPVRDTSGGLVLVSFDRVTGAFVDTVRVAPAPTFAMEIAIQDPWTIVTWVDTDRNETRSIVVDASGAVLGRTVARTGSAPRFVTTGATNDGPRVLVSDVYGSAIFVEPCVVRP